MLAAGSVLWLFHMGLGLTVIVVGAILLGGLGVWRLADLFPSNRERIVALVTYVAMPLLPGVISTGRLSALVAFAALPWFVHLVRSAAGIGTADPERCRRRPGRRRDLHSAPASESAASPSPASSSPSPSPSPRRSSSSSPRVTVVLALSSLLVGAGWRTSSWMLVAGAAAAAVGWVLNLPAATTWSWNDLTAVPLAGAPGRGLDDVASMNIGRARLGLLTLGPVRPGGHRAWCSRGRGG